MFTNVHQCFFLLNIINFSVCLTSNKLYWIEDQLADVSTRFYTSASWSVGELVRRRVGPSASWPVGELTGYRKNCFKRSLALVRLPIHYNLKTEEQSKDTDVLYEHDFIVLYCSTYLVSPIAVIL